MTSPRVDRTNHSTTTVIAKNRNLQRSSCSSRLRKSQCTQNFYPIPRAHTAFDSQEVVFFLPTVNDLLQNSLSVKILSYSRKEKCNWTSREPNPGDQLESYANRHSNQFTRSGTSLCWGAQRLAVNKPQARGSTLEARLGLEKVELYLQLHDTTASRAFVSESKSEKNNRLNFQKLHQKLV